ncbi:MAG TPA: isoprenylcysteine carboxylmethyltransferase family protein [Nitrospirota bacterium]|nr:isoprenylcysteine carboxylmethyltransferase family protein [Nitrospirota bacterium]
MRAIQLGGATFGLLAFKQLDAGEFLGLRQIARYWKHGEVAGNTGGLTGNKLVTAGVYGMVRHPLYPAGIVLFTFNPSFTRNSLTISGLAGLYFVFGSFLEEKRLIGVFGDRYEEHRKRVPRLMPRIFHP